MNRPAEAATRDTASQACPDAEELAAWAEGRLTGARRDAIERHVASPCAECAAVAAALWSAHDTFAPPTTVAPRRAGLWIAAAAVAGVAFGLAIANATRGDPHSALAVASRALADEEPELFSGFAPLTDAELREPSPELRGAAAGLVLFHPRGLVASEKPALRFSPGTGTVDWTVEVAASDGARVGTTALPQTAGKALVDVAWPLAPALERGRTYLVTLRAAGVLGDEASTAVVTVATADALARFERGLAAIGSREGSLGLRTHWALRCGLLAEARTAAEAWAMKAPGDADARAALAYVNARLGAAEPEPR